MEILEIKACRREVGKGWAKKYRKEGKIPAILYGHYLKESIPLVIDRKEFQKLFKKGKYEIETYILKINIEDGEESKVENALLQDFQIDPLTDSIIHADFHAVRMDEIVDTHIPILLVGDAIGIKKGGVLQHGISEIYVRILPVDIPNHVEVDISNLDIGDSILVRDIKVSEKIKILTPLNEVVVSILAPQRGEIEAEATVEGEITI